MGIWVEVDRSLKISSINYKIGKLYFSSSEHETDFRERERERGDSEQHGVEFDVSVKSGKKEIMTKMILAQWECDFFVVVGENGLPSG
jgi:hypothetical protein